MTRLIKILPLLLFIFPPFGGIEGGCQNPEIKRTNIWYFGENAGIDFNSGNPVALTDGQLNSNEACAVISDTAGNLLFYTDAETVWNRNHMIMQNGTGLLGCQSSTQGALIVPKPGNDSIYYIFTTDCAENNLINGLRYSEVNMMQDGGQGAVTAKNILLRTPVTEKLTGVHHANGQDVWVIAHEWDTDSFLAYLVTGAGVNIVPVTTNIGAIHSGDQLNATGYMKISPNGKKLASAIYNFGPVELFDFDNTTGIVSNEISLPPDVNNYGVSFSSGSCKLYVSTSSGFLYQYDLISGIPANIIASKTLILPDTTIAASLGGLHLASDGKIYVSVISGTWPYDTINIINNPNELGAGCNFTHGFSLAGKSTGGGLSNFIESYFEDSCISVSTNEISNLVYSFSVYPNPFNDIATVVFSDNISRLSFSIYDILGKKVKETASYYSSGTNRFKINRNNLQSGLYIMEVQTEHNTITQKILITN